MILNSVIIDDENKAALALNNVVRNYLTDVKVVGIAGDVRSGVEMIKDLKPDIVFLDIILPDETGFELLKYFSPVPFEVVFVSSHEEFALHAIKCSALGYLLKPVAASDIREVMVQIRDRFELKNKEKLYEALRINLDGDRMEDHQITIYGKKGFEVVNVKDIVRCEGFNRYTKIVMDNGKVFVSAYNLGRYQSLLERYSFIVVHRSFMINKLHITKFQNDSHVLMSDGAIIPVAARKRAEILNLFKSRK